MATWNDNLVNQLVALYKDDKTYNQIAEELNLRKSQVRQKISSLGIAKNLYKWSEDEERMLIEAYLNCEYSYELMLDDLSKKLKRLKSNVCRKARAFGLTDIARKQLPVEMQKIKKPKYATKEERNAAQSKNSKAWIAKNGHPRGALGMKHTEENKQKQSIRSKARMNAMSEEEKTHAELIEEIISAKLRPFYWIFGILVMVFMTVSVPLTGTLIETVRIQQTKISTEDAEKTYMNKLEYLQIEQDEHRVMQEILKTPESAPYLFGIINDNIADALGFKYTSRGATK